MILLIPIDKERRERLNKPVLQVSFIRRQRSFTDEALRPRTAPMAAQSEPCCLRSLYQTYERS